MYIDCYYWTYSISVTLKFIELVWSGLKTWNFESDLELLGEADFVL